MPLLTTAEDADLEAEMLDELTDSCVVNEVTSSKNSNGVTRTKSPRGAAVDCAYGILSGRELERAQKIAPEATVGVTLPKATVVEASDVLDITDNLTDEVLSVQVVYVGKATGRRWLGVYATWYKG